MATHLVAFLQHVPVGGSTQPPTGRAVVETALLYAGVTAAAVLLAVALGRGRHRLLGLLGGLLLVLAAARLTASGPTPLMAAHLGAVAVWLGAVLRLLRLAAGRSRGADLLAAARALTPWAVGAAVVAVATGVLLSRSEGLGVGDLGTTGFGRLIATKGGLVLLAGLLGVAHRLFAPAPARLVRLEALVLAAALAVGATLLVVPLRRTLDQLAPGLALVDLGRDGRVTLFLATTGGRTQLVLLSDEPVAVTDRTSGRTLQVSPGAAVPVGLTDGRASLQVLSGWTRRTVHPTSVTLPTTWGRTTDALAAGVGAVLGGRLPTSPAGCSSSAEAWGRAAAALLADVGGLSVVRGDDSRSRAFLSGARSAGLRTTQVGTSVLLAVDKAEALRWLSAPHPARAVYLAPWLLDRDVLALVDRHRLPPLLVLGTADAMSPAADRYRQDLAMLGAGLAPSADGLQAYLTARQVGLPPRAALFAATPVGFLPGVLDEGHTHASSASWVPGGSLVEVSRPQPVSCPTT